MTELRIEHFEQMELDEQLEQLDAHGSHRNVDGFMKCFSLHVHLPDKGNQGMILEKCKIDTLVGSSSN
jgi:hypothetical protein